MDSGFLKFPDSSYPDEIPIEFSNLREIGKKEVLVEICGIKWRLATLEEWEEREIAKKLSSYDLNAKDRLKPVEVLTHSIQSCIVPKHTGGYETFDFTYEDKKQILRSVLLILDPKVTYYIYLAYQLLLQVAQREFETSYPNLEKQLAHDILGTNVEESTEQQITPKENPSDVAKNV